MNANRRIRLPRDSGGAIDLEGGTGGITGMCTCEKFLEVYKQDRTFRIQSPEAIDPDRTNPNAPFLAALHDTVGSSSPAVARVLLQGIEILKAAILRQPVDESLVIEVLHTCKEAVVVCEKVSLRVASEVDTIKGRIEESGIRRDKHGKALNPFPQVADLQADATAFLIHAKRAILEICRLPSIFNLVAPGDNNFDALAKKLAAAIGRDAAVTEFVLANADVVRYLIDLRNYQEHPGDKRTVIENFALKPNGTINVPAWYVSGSSPHSIQKDMIDGAQFLVETAELMLIHLVLHSVDDRYPFEIQRLDDAQIHETKPIRYRLSIKLRAVAPSTRGVSS